MGELIHQLLERNARKYPLEQAVRWPQEDSELTWAELNARSNMLANYLVARGIKPGEKAAIFVSNRPEFLISYFGTLKAGAVVIPLNVKFTPSEVSYILGNSGAAVLFYEDELRPVAEEAVKELPGIKVTLSSLDVSDLENDYTGGDLNLSLNPTDLAEMLYTSGTTGKPKGVLLTHNAITLVAMMMAYEADIRHGDRCLHLMPLTHSAPLNLLMVGGTWAGASHVLGNFTPQALLELTHREKTTHFFGAPVVYSLTGRMPNFSDFDLSSAKRWIYGGAPMPRASLDSMMSLFPGGFMGVYGLTEAGPNGTALHPHEHPEYAGSIGQIGRASCRERV